MHYLNPAVRTKSVKTRNAKVYVLDSFAVLGYLENESSASFVRDLFRQARKGAIDLWLSLMNYGEVLYIVERERSLQAAQRTIGIIDQLPISIAGVDRQTVFSAAHFKARYPISYADAFSAVLARDRNAALLTGDPEFRLLEGEIDIHWLPR
jgi:predicted nucleic acid-binding protein